MTHSTAFVTPVVVHWLKREIAQWVHHEGLIRRPIAPWANALTTELHLAPKSNKYKCYIAMFALDISKTKVVGVTSRVIRSGQTPLPGWSGVLSMAIYSFADINHDSTTRIPSSNSWVAPQGKQSVSYVGIGHSQRVCSYVVNAQLMSGWFEIKHGLSPLITILFDTDITVNKNVLHIIKYIIIIIIYSFVSVGLSCPILEKDIFIKNSL